MVALFRDGHALVKIAHRQGEGLVERHHFTQSVQSREYLNLAARVQHAPPRPANAKARAHCTACMTEHSPCTRIPGRLSWLEGYLTSHYQLVHRPLDDQVPTLPTPPRGPWPPSSTLATPHSNRSTQITDPALQRKSRAARQVTPAASNDT